MQSSGHTQPQWHNEDAQRSSRMSSLPNEPSAAAVGSTMSIGEQLMQVDQAITLTLQEIDANFAKTHQTITARILPAIKRYGIASHNTWQGAKFWHRFFETASDINLAPGRRNDGSEDGSLAAEQTAMTSYENEGDAYDATYGQNDGHGERRGARALDESGELHEDDFEPPRMSDASVAASKRLMRQQRSGGGQDDQSLDDAMNDLSFDRRSPPPQASGSRPRRSDGNRREGLQGPSRTVFATPRSGKKASNPFNRKTSANGADGWNGIADLRKTPLAVGSVGAKDKKARAAGKASKKGAGFDDEDEDSLAWPAGMSPPVTMQFSVPRSRFDKTPAKEAARMVVDDLLRTVEGSTPAARRLMMQQREAAAATAAGPSTQTTPGKSRSAKTEAMSATGKALKGRPSMPTPPTITKRVGGGAGSLSQRHKESTPKGLSSASRLMDEDEQGQGTFDDEAMNISNAKASALHLAGDDEDDEDSDNDNEYDSDDDEEEDNDAIDAGPLPSLTRPRGVLTRDEAGGNGRQTGHTASSISHSIDEDTLFGIRDPSLSSASKRAGIQVPASSKPTSTQKNVSAAHGTHRAAATTAATPSARSFQPMGHVQNLGTFYRGRPLLDDDRARDETFSAPSPTPAGQQRRE